MRVIVLLFIFALGTIKTSFGQNDFSKYINNSATEVRLKTYVYDLASDSMQGRGTGSLGNDIAANYIAYDFKNSGLLPAVGDSSYFQEVTLLKDFTSEFYFKIDGRSAMPGDDFYCDKGILKDSIRFRTHEIVFAGYGISEGRWIDPLFDTISLKNKAVMIVDGEPISNDINLISGKSGSFVGVDKIENIKKRNPKVILVVTEKFPVSPYYYKKLINKTSLNLESQGSSNKNNIDSIPVIYIAKNVADELVKNKKTTVSRLIERQLEDKRPETFTLNRNIDFSILNKTEKIISRNVVAISPGTDLSDEYIVVSAHYDHLGVFEGQTYFGADDNASGVGGILSIANAFAAAKKDNNGSRRSVLFIAFTGEEKGLLGSEYYSLNPIVPMGSVVANLNVDMIGRIDKMHTDGNYIYVIGSDKLSSELKQISTDVNLQTVKLNLDYTFDAPNDPNRFYYRSDHYNFAKNNIPVIFYFNGVHDDYHKPTDTPDKINIPVMQKRVQLIGFTAWELSNKENRLIINNSK